MRKVIFCSQDHRIFERSTESIENIKWHCIYSSYVHVYGGLEFLDDVVSM